MIYNFSHTHTQNQMQFVNSEIQASTMRSLFYVLEPGSSPSMYGPLPPSHGPSPVTSLSAHWCHPTSVWPSLLLYSFLSSRLWPERKCSNNMSFLACLACNLLCCTVSNILLCLLLPGEQTQLKYRARDTKIWTCTSSRYPGNVSKWSLRKYGTLATERRQDSKVPPGKTRA